MLNTTTTEQDEQIEQASRIAEYLDNLMEILASMDDRIRDLEERERELLAEIASLEQRLASNDFIRI